MSEHIFLRVICKDYMRKVRCLSDQDIKGLTIGYVGMTSLQVKVHLGRKFIWDEVNASVFITVL